MFTYCRFLIAIFTFAIGISAVWAVAPVTAGVSVLGIPFVQPEVIEVAPPKIVDPPAVRFKHHGKHSHCRKSARSSALR